MSGALLAGRAGLAARVGIPRSAHRSLLHSSRPRRVCGGRKAHPRRPIVLAAMATPAWPAALVAAAGTGPALGTFALAGLVMAALLALAAGWRRNSGDLPKMPGPKQLPLIGNLADLGHPQAHQTIADWANRFGSLVRWVHQLGNQTGPQLPQGPRAAVPPQHAHH